MEIENQYHNVYVLKRPGVDEFMRKMGEQYEIVVFTASLSKVLSDAFHHCLFFNTLYIVCRSCFGQVGYTQCRKASVIQGSLLQLQRHLRQGMVHCCLAAMWITSVSS